MLCSVLLFESFSDYLVAYQLEGQNCLILVIKQQRNTRN